MATAVQEAQISNLHDSDEHLEFSKVRMVAVEFAIAVLIALLFFFIIVGIINLSLPIGTSVRDLVKSIGASTSQAGSRELAFARGDQDLDPAAGGSFTAKLAEISNRVNVKSANDIAWSTANHGMSLFHRDAVQTYERSRALIEFDESNFLDIGENSLVVLQRMEPDPFVNKMRTFRVMVEGELRGKLSRSGDGLTNLQVALPSGELSLLPGAGSGDGVEFRVAVGSDQSSTLAVYKGDAQVLVGGKRVHIGENHGLQIGADGKPLAPVELPPQPVTKSPSDESAAFYRELPPKIRFSWEPTKSASSYRFVLARDPEFRQILVDERLTRPIFAHGNLRGGRYYWRVHSLVDHVESAPSEMRRLTMVQDRKPPVLDVQAPPKVVHQAAITLHGRTEPGAKVYVEGEPVKVNREGAFTHTIRIKPGATLIVVEAVDPAGNVAYATNLVNGKF